MNTPNIKKGFYYHYKHDPEKGINDHAYEVIGIGMHTEDRSLTVIYRPLYKNTFLPPADFCARPYEMFIENVEKNGKTVPRFQKITDREIIAQIEIIKG
jgi:hypothetical protein